MNLLIDIGNTASKAAWAEGLTLGKTYRYQGEKVIDFISSITASEKPAMIVVSSNKPLSPFRRNALAQLCGKLVVLDTTNEKFYEHYSLPSYLSPDRCASIIAARNMFKGSGCSIFDLGNTITSDFIDAEGNYIGGRITLGCVSRYKGLNRYAKNIPFLTVTDNVPEIGTDLESSIHSGIVGGIVFELSTQAAQYPENVVILTGADANYFVKRLKNSIFAVCNLVLIGLAQISENYNEDYF